MRVVVKRPKFLFVVMALAVIATGCNTPQWGAIACPDASGIHGCEMVGDAPNKTIATQGALKACGTSCSIQLATKRCGAVAQERGSKNFEAREGKTEWEANYRAIAACHATAESPCDVVANIPCSGE